MVAKSKPTWIAVLDGNEARFFALRRSDDGQIFEEAAGPLSARRVSRSDKPGRGVSAGSGGQPKITPQKLDTLQFTRDVAAALDAAFAEKRFDQLVLVAPARLLADLREHLSSRVSASVAHQVPKNLIKLSTDALWEKLSAILLKAARPVVGSTAREPAMNGSKLPVSVVFRNMDASATVEAEAHKHAAKLGRKFGRIQNCRVTVEAPKHEHRKVKEFRVAVAMKLPGREIATRSGEGAAHEDLGIAMRDAFAAAMRQLEGSVRRIKDGMLRERRKSSPRLRGFAEA